MKKVKRTNLGKAGFECGRDSSRYAIGSVMTLEMPRPSHERNEDMSLLVIEEIRLKSYIDNFHTRHLTFKAAIAKREGECSAMEQRYQTLIEEGAAERRALRKERERVQRRTARVGEKVAAAEENLKMLRLEHTDCDIRAQIIQAKLNYVCDSIAEDKKNLALLVQQMSAEIASLQKDTARIDAASETEATKVGSFLRLCGLAEEHLEQVHSRWLAIWPLLQSWQRAAKLRALSAAASTSLQGFSAETATLRACVMRLGHLPRFSHSEVDCAVGASGGNGDISAPIRDLCAALEEELLDAQTRSEGLRTLLTRLQRQRQRGGDAIASLCRAVDADLRATKEKVGPRNEPPLTLTLTLTSTRLT